MELQLDRKMQQKNIPATIFNPGTRREDLLMDKETASLDP